MRRRKRNTPQQKMTHEQYKMKAAALTSVRGKIKDLKNQEAELKDDVISFVNNMPKNEDKSYTDILQYPNVSYDLAYTPRVQTVFVDNAMDLIDEWGLSDLLIEQVPTINKEWVMQAYKNGELTDEQLSTITEEKINYQLSIKPRK